MDFSQIKKILESFGLDDTSLGNLFQMLKPFLATLFKVDSETLDTLIRLVPKILSGDIDFKKLLPMALPVLLSYFSSTEQQKSAEQQGSADLEENAELSRDLINISPDAYSQIELFLQNDTASL